MYDLPQFLTISQICSWFSNEKKKRFILLANIHDDVERVLRKRALGAVLLFAVVSVESRFAGEINHFADVQRQFAVVGRLESLFGEAVRTSSDALLHVFKESRAAGDFPARFWGYGSLVFRLGCTGKRRNKSVYLFINQYTNQSIV